MIWITWISLSNLNTKYLVDAIVAMINHLRSGGLSKEVHDDKKESG